MDKHEELCNRITKALEFFSSKITMQVDDYFYDKDSEHVLIYLINGSNRVQFCHLLEATGLFTESDDIRVVFTPSKQE